MECLTAKPYLHGLHLGIALPRSPVERVAEEWVSHLREVNADLVRAPGLEADLQESGSVQPLPDAPGGDRRLAGLRAPGEALPIARMPGVECLEPARVGR